MPSTLDRLRLLRAHLVRNWDVADEWKDKIEASNGAPCLMTLGDDGMTKYKASSRNSPLIMCGILDKDAFCGYAVTLMNQKDGRYYVQRRSVIDAIGGDPLIMLRAVGKVRLCTALDRAIARLEEHEMAEGNAGSRPVRMDSRAEREQKERESEKCPARPHAQAVPRRAENTSAPSVA